jgi:hypothetical protein
MPIGLKGNTDGSGAVQIGGSDAITISTGLNTTFAGTVTASGGVLYPLTSGTAIASTSGTALDFTSIPSWVKRITVMLNGVSTNGTSNYLIQIGNGSFNTSGYAATSLRADASGNGFSTSTAGFIISATSSSASVSGLVTIAATSSSNYVSSHSLNMGTQITCGGGTSGTISGPIDRVRITTVNGTDTFDAGSINILFE